MEQNEAWPPISNTSQSIADLLRLESLPHDLDLDEEGQGEGQRLSR